ncbi:MAG TPA: DUF1345 domain-containing protein [Rhodanobacteraceae bacterium]|jgi:uncharacterized membrane protein|nr:DUF1345 domain-containing protein [Rhodanobacteraceae bacterium]
MADTAIPQDGSSWLHRHTRAVRYRPHFSTAAALFLVLLATLIGAGAGLARGMLLSFDGAALIFLAGIAWMFSRSPVATIRARVAKQDAGRWGVLWSGVAMSSVAVVALGVELHASETSGVLGLAVAATSLVLSWCVLNTMFALHYAHEYYMGARKDKALEFPGDEEPDYWDFMYFAFVLGMTFQVSDVAIARRSVRRVALAHGVLAFFFDVFILALTVNAVAGKF